MKKGSKPVTTTGSGSRQNSKKVESQGSKQGSKKVENKIVIESSGN